MNRFFRPSYAPRLSKSSGSARVCKLLIISKLRAAGSVFSVTMAMIDSDQFRAAGKGSFLPTIVAEQTEDRLNDISF
jgi:hypothetical protein